MTITSEVVMSTSIAILVVERGWSILKELRNNGNGHCKDHHRLMAMVEKLADDEKEDSFAKRIENAVRRGMSVSGSDPRD